MQTPIRKAIFPVIGFDTNVASIQHAIDEASSIGVSEFIFISDDEKQTFKNHFGGTHVHQAVPAELGEVLLLAQEIIGDEAFAVLLADKAIVLPTHTPNAMQQIFRGYQLAAGNFFAVQRIPYEWSDQHTVVAVDPNTGYLLKMQNIMENPQPAAAPSNLALVGRYILRPQIFTLLRQAYSNERKASLFIEAVAELLHVEDCYAHELAGIVMTPQDGLEPLTP